MLILVTDGRYTGNGGEAMDALQRVATEILGEEVSST